MNQKLTERKWSVFRRTVLVLLLACAVMQGVITYQVRNLNKPTGVMIMVPQQQGGTETKGNLL